MSAAPIHIRPPANWDQMTYEEQMEWARQVKEAVLQESSAGTSPDTASTGTETPAE